MTAVATHEPLTERPPAEGSASPRLFEPGGVTLEDAVLDTWGDLLTRGEAECPVCGGSMSAVSGCDSCGAELS